MPEPLSASQLEDRLDESLDPVLSSRRTAAGLARSLTVLSRPQQEFVLRWAAIIAKSNAELAYQFAQSAPRAFGLMNTDDVEGWLIHAMDVYDKSGLYPAAAIFNRVDDYAVRTQDQARGVSFEEVAGVLELFVRGLSGRALKLDVGDQVYTDSATLYLPRRLSLFTDRDDNFRLYKACVTQLWAQTWYGSFHGGLSRRLQNYEDPERAAGHYCFLEVLRLDACLARDLPGLHRDMQALQRRAGPLPLPPPWRAAQEALQQPEAGADTSYRWLRVLYREPLPGRFCYQGILLPGQVDETMQARMDKERRELGERLARLAAELGEQLATGESPEGAAATPRFELRQAPDPDRPDHVRLQLELNRQPVTPPVELRRLMDSIIQDLGEIPPDYLVAAGDGGYRKGPDPKDEPGDGRYEDALPYNEWDYRRQHYRKNWCWLRELDVHPSPDLFVQRTRRKYAGLMMNLRKTFEALRGEEKLLKRQTHGDDIDFDALVEARAELLRGMEMPERLFTKAQKLERDIAVMFMVDMSGSTKGWINDAERESLVLLCEALEILGDRYAIYGFSGMSRKRCELFRVKRFDEPYSDEVRARITGIKPQDYTRMGVSIRHLSKLLAEVEARTKLLITLSDGKPDDFDGYRGDYGIEDTRQALIEAKHLGIHPFCITIDKEARDYLPHMYGAVNYAVIDDVRKLPLKVADIYRRLTL